MFLRLPWPADRRNVGIRYAPPGVSSFRGCPAAFPSPRVEEVKTGDEIASQTEFHS